MKNIRKNSLLILIIMAIILFFVLKDDFSSIINTLVNINLLWLFVAILCIFLYWSLKAYSLYVLVKEQQKNISFFSILQQAVIAQFFNGITPFATGGQPMQIYMLKKSGVKVANATNIIVQNFIFFQTALILHGLLALYINYKFHIININSAVQTLIMVGFIINTIIGVVLLFISFSTKFNDFLGKLIIRIAHKAKIVKNKEKTIEKWNQKLAEYHNNAVVLKEKKGLFLKGFIADFIALLCLYITPLFVVYSMGDFTSLNVISTCVASAFVLIIGNFVPIPGGSGGIEYGFLRFFQPFLIGPALPAALLLWRFITYYLGIIIGGISFGFFKGEVKT